MSLDLFSLEGKVALVTGASKGIGRAIALGLAGAGADVALAGRDQAQMEEVASEVRALGRKALPVVADVRVGVEVQTMVARCIEVFERIDILVNNAGTMVKKLLLDMTEEEWDRVLDTNLKGYFLCAQAVGRAMIKEKKGKIINISSVRNQATFPALGPYSASKGGVTMLTRTLALEWLPYNIRVNEIAPGFVETPMTQYLKKNREEYEWTLKRIPMGRWADPKELVGAAIFLVSEASSYMTGQTIYLDGGWLCW